MKTIKHKNITINVDDSDLGIFGEGMQDDTDWYMKTKDFFYMYKKTFDTTIGEDIEEDNNPFKDTSIELIEMFENVIDEYNDLEEPSFNIGEYIDSVLSKEEELICISDTDAMILILNGIISHVTGNTKQYEFDVSAKPFWICHDLMHAEKDVVSNTIYVNADVEEQRIIDAWEYSLLQGISEPLTKQEFEELKEAFKYRFKRDLICRDIETYFEEQLMSELEEDE